MTGNHGRLRNLFNLRSRDIWHSLYEEMLPRVFHYFAYRVGNLQAAEDLTSATFEKAWKARQQYQPAKGKVEQWIFGIAGRVLADQKRQPEVPVMEFETDRIPSDFSVERIVDHKQRFQKLTLLLNKQPERTRELISLKYGAGLNNREIARLTGLSESNVGTILHRAVKTLREKWENEDE